MNRRNPFIRLAVTLVVLLSGCSRVESDWNEARKTNTVRAYTEFIAKYPQAAHAADARHAVEELDWSAAKETNSQAGYVAYLEKYSPRTNSPAAVTSDRPPSDKPYLAPGQTGNRSLYGDVTEHDEDARKAIEQLDWQQAKKANSIPSYTAFLTKYPNTSEANDARQAVRYRVLVKSDGLSLAFSQDISISMGMGFSGTAYASANHLRCTGTNGKAVEIELISTDPHTNVGVENGKVAIRTKNFGTIYRGNEEGKFEVYEMAESQIAKLKVLLE